MPPQDRIPEFDLYAELKVERDADAAIVERAWRAGVQSLHPDRASSAEEAEATMRTARLNIAREWLLDPSKRARYDELRRPGPYVELPDMDPMGTWPRRRPRKVRPTWLRFLMQGLPAFITIMFLSLLMGGVGIAAMLATGFGLFALYAIAWVLVGVLARR